MVTIFSLFLFILLGLLCSLCCSEPTGVYRKFENRTTSVAVKIGDEGRSSDVNFFLVSDLDGNLHAIDYKSGQQMWSFSSGSSLIHSSNHIHPALHEKEDDKNKYNQEHDDEADTVETIFPGTDGALYAYSSVQGVYRLAVNMKELVDSSPSVSPDGSVLLGSKSTEAFALDASSGKVIHRLNSVPVTPDSSGESTMADGGGQLLPLAGSGSGSGPILVVMRTDLSLKSVELRSGRQVWNMSVGEFTFLNSGWPAVRASSMAGQGEDIAAMAATLQMADGVVKRVDELSGEHLWQTKLDAPPVALYTFSGAVIRKLAMPLPAHLQTPGMLHSNSETAVYALPPAVLTAGKAQKATLTQNALSVLPGRCRPVALQQVGSSGSSSSSHGIRASPLEDLQCSSSNICINGLPAWQSKNPLLPSVASSGGCVKENTLTISEGDTGDDSLYPALPPLPSPVPMSPLLGRIIHSSSPTQYLLLLAPLILLLLILRSLSPLLGAAARQPAPAPAAPLMEASPEKAVDPFIAKIGSGGKRKKGRRNGGADAGSGDRGRLHRAVGAMEHVGAGQRIGRLFVSSTVIGHGSHGTVVVEGELEGRRVAVKRMLVQFYDQARKEIEALIASDEHPNVVRCFAMEEDSSFVYMALERCAFTLAQLIAAAAAPAPNGAADAAVMSALSAVGWQPSSQQTLSSLLWDPSSLSPTPLLLQLMADVVSGVGHVHHLGYIHRDLKPANVLITVSVSRESGALVLRAKLSDMGISKRLALGGGDESHTATTGVGSAGWQAPEQLQQNGRQSRAVDMFSVGCLLYYCLTAGRHPFDLGSKFERDANIVKGHYDLLLVDHLPEAQHLLHSLLSSQPCSRFTADAVLRHPLLWSPDERLNFLKDASDRVEGEDREESSTLLAAIEAEGPTALGGCWNDRLESELLSNLGRYRRYNYHSVRDLLRVIRNKCNHYRELPSSLQTVLGPVPEGYEQYFRCRFPHLLMRVYIVLHQFCKDDAIFRRYFS